MWMTVARVILTLGDCSDGMIIHHYWVVSKRKDLPIEYASFCIKKDWKHKSLLVGVDWFWWDQHIIFHLMATWNLFLCKFGSIEWYLYQWKIFSASRWVVTAVKKDLRKIWRTIPACSCWVLWKENNQTFWGKSYSCTC